MQEISTTEDFSVVQKEGSRMDFSGKGSITKKSADKIAHEEYDKFNKTQKIVSDFDKEVKKLIEGGDSNE